MSSTDKSKSSKVIESRDIFFFYRPKVDSKKVEIIKDVQRLYMILAPENNTQNKKENIRNIYRLFLLGRKKLPNIIKGEIQSKRKKIDIQCIDYYRCR
ncbi:protein of unknown function [Candidatus Nitrosocosmicus franklandus]|uniref:Uncharacterized protein n=1 Tax=Candidatus Nitrosocosmicus franklandianus TaxID=1798806 RepID=A0A484IBK0_9ARCH|nr:protein of unknown function [Candidatus Nitrosocosmicus franklandus]